MTETNQNDAITQQLTAMMPKSLDDIVRKNRHLCRLILASDEEIATMKSPISAGTSVKYTLEKWNLIVIHVTSPQGERSTAHLVGYVRGSGVPWMTSLVAGIDLKTRRIETQNSMYGIWGRRGAEKDIDLSFVCAVLNGWGFGPQLGIPPFFL